MKKLLIPLLLVISFAASAQTSITPQFVHKLPADSLLGYKVPGTIGTHWIGDTAYNNKKFAKKNVYTASQGVKLVGTNFSLDTVFTGLRFLSINQTGPQVIKSPITIDSSLLVIKNIQANGNLSTNGSLSVSGGASFGGNVTFVSGVQIPTSIRFNNGHNSGFDWYGGNGQQSTVAGSLDFSYADNTHGIRFLLNDIYDFAGNKFLKSGVGGHANADSLGGQLPSYYLNRANHTGSQAESTITNLVTDLASKQATLTGPGYVKMVAGSPTYITSIANADLANSAITVQGTSVSLGSSVNPINGTGFVKATGTTISYDNSTYLTSNQSISFSPTGDVTGSASGATSLAPVLSIGAGKVTNTMLAGSIDLTTKVTGVLPNTNTTATSAATASAIAARDANANTTINNLIENYATTVTAAGTTALTVGSAFQQYFTGSTTQTVTLPVASTLVVGMQYQIINNSTGIVTVQSSGANTVQALATNTSAVFTCILASGTTAASWNVQYTGTPALSAAKWTIARTLAGNSVDGSANVAFTNKFIVQGTTDAGLTGAQFLGALGTGLLKNTTTTGVLSIAVAGTDFQAPLTFDSTPTTSSTNPVTSGSVFTALGLKANLASPALTGSPTAPTQSALTNNTTLATTAYADGAVTAAATYFQAAMITGSGTFASPYGIANNYITPAMLNSSSGVAGSTTVYYGDGHWATPAGGASGANPTATIGLTAVNGSATTFMRSDAAPALSQSITPTMLGLWTYQQNAIGSTSTDALLINNSTLATSGVAAQWSPSVHLQGTYWTGSVSAPSDWKIENQVSGTQGLLVFKFSNNGAAYSNAMYLSPGAINSSGLLNLNQGFFGATSTEVLLIKNGAAASAGTPLQKSGASDYFGSVWNTTATAAANYMSFRQEAGGVSGTTPTGTFDTYGYVGTSTTPTYTKLTSLDAATGNLSLLTGGLSTNNIKLNGATSGVITMQAQAAAGTYNWNLPTTAGTSGFLLTSAGGGSGAMTWTDPATLGGATGANPTANIGLSAVNGVATTFMRSDAAPALNQAITPTWTNPHTYSFPGIGVTSTDALILANTTAAGASTPQWSPAIHFQGNYYTGSASQSTDWKIENQAQASGSNQGLLVFRYALNGGAYSTAFYASPGGITTGGQMTLNQGFFGSTSTDVLMLTNGAAATVGTTLQKSGAERFFGSVWNTTATAAANYFAFRQEAGGVSGTTPTGTLDTYGSLTTTTTPSYTKLTSLDAATGNFSLLTGSLTTRHVIGGGSAPTIAAGTGAGTSPTVSIGAGSTDLDGVITLTTGTSPTASGIIATVTFNTAYASAPSVVISNGSTTFSALTVAQMPFTPARGQTNNPTTTTFVIQAGTAALPASTVYAWTYHVVQ